MNEPVEYLLSSAPVVVRRKARWGECDPAGVVYTPRFADYAISAFEYFIAELVGYPAQQAMIDEGFGLPMKAMSSEFHFSIWPDQYFDMTVRVGSMRTRTFDLVVTAQSLEHRPLFTTVLSPICIAPDKRASIPIPVRFRQRLESYRDAHGGADLPAKDVPS